MNAFFQAFALLILACAVISAMGWLMDRPGVLVGILGTAAGAFYLTFAGLWGDFGTVAFWGIVAAVFLAIPYTVVEMFRFYRQIFGLEKK